jgi:hypothetical protein
MDGREESSQGLPQRGLKVGCSRAAAQGDIYFHRGLRNYLFIGSDYKKGRRGQRMRPGAGTVEVKNNFLGSLPLETGG